MGNLSRETEIVPSTATRVCSGTTTFYCHADVSNAEGVLFIVIGSSHATAKTTESYFHLQGSSYSSAGWTLLGSSALLSSTKYATGQTEKYLMVDCYKPTRKFVRLCSHHTTGDISVVGIKYGMRLQGSTDVLGRTGGAIGAGCYALSVSAT